MPKKTDEETRNRIVALRKEGLSYSRIRGETGVSQPVVAKVLKEAGLTAPKGTALGAGAPSVASVPSTGASEPAGSPATAREGNVDEFLPRRAPKVADQVRTVRGECSSCGTALELKVKGELSSEDQCPECGEALA